MIKAIFFDIDGTLVNHQLKMPSSTKKTLTLLKEKGIKVFVATGRPHQSMGFIEEYFDFDGFLTTNGQYCVDHNHHIIHEMWLDEQDVQAMIHYIQQNDIICTVAQDDKVYINKQVETPPGTQVQVDDFSTSQGHRVYQMMPRIFPEEDEAFLAVAPHCQSQRWTDTFMDVVPVQGGKDKGIDEIIKYYHISLEETMAFGDGGNDIGMLQHVKIGVAMGNANEKVKAAADYVTTSIDDDGIYNALKYHKII